MTNIPKVNYFHQKFSCRNRARYLLMGCPASPGLMYTDAAVYRQKLNFHPSTLPSEPSCTKSVRIEYEGLTVDLKQNLQVLINGEMPPMVPWWVDGIYIKYASSLFISGKKIDRTT